MTSPPKTPNFQFSNSKLFICVKVQMTSARYRMYWTILTSDLQVQPLECEIKLIAKEQEYFF